MTVNLDPIREALTEAKTALHNADSLAFTEFDSKDAKAFHDDYLQALNILDRLHSFRPGGSAGGKRKL